MTFLTRDKNFYRDTVKIALPLSLQFLLANLLNLLDTLMIGYLGEQPLAGVMAGNNVFFIFSLFIVGVSSGAGIYAAQYYGSKNYDGIRKVLGISLTLGVGFAVLFTAVILAMPLTISKAFSTDPVVIEYAKNYMLIVLISYIPTAIIECYFGVLKSTEQVKIPLFVSVVALSINTVLNYVLIYGKFGFPQMGVAGAAVATVVSRGVQVVLLLLLIYKDRHIVACGLKKLFSFNRKLLTEFLKVSMPVMANEAFWGIGFTGYNVIYGRMGTTALAVAAIVSNADKIFSFCFLGVGYASLAVVGKKLGEKQEEAAYDYAISFVWLSAIVGAVFGILLIILAPFLLSLYTIEPATYEAAHQILIILGCFMPIKILNCLIIVGLLRSGGDTVATAAIDLSAVWLIGLPLGVLGGILLKLPMPIVYFMISLEEIYKFTLGIKRLLSKKWIKLLD